MRSHIRSSKLLRTSCSGIQEVGYEPHTQASHPDCISWLWLHDKVWGRVLGFIFSHNTLNTESGHLIELDVRMHMYMYWQRASTIVHTCYYPFLSRFIGGGGQ
jgi:hypothetical protein